MTAEVTYKPNYAANRQYVAEKPLIDLTGMPCPVDEALAEAEERTVQ